MRAPTNAKANCVGCSGYVKTGIYFCDAYCKHGHPISAHRQMCMIDEHGIMSRHHYDDSGKPIIRGDQQ